MNGIYRRAAELAGDDASILSEVGDYFVLSKQVKEAIPYYLKSSPRRRRRRILLLSNTRQKLARAFIVNQQRDEAIEVLEKMAKEDSDALRHVRAARGIVRAERGVRQGAAQLRAQPAARRQPAAELSAPDFPTAPDEKAEKAVEIMKQARKRFPDIPQITKNLAVTLSQAKRHTDAMTTFAEAMAEAENNHDDLLNYEFYFQYGAAAEQAGLTEKAAELLKQSIELEPNNAAQAYNYLGYMWADRGENLDEATEMIKKALELDPDNGAFIDSLGWLYFKKGEYDKALKELQRAAEVIKPEDAVVFDHLA
jgi:tetratricopeptide (TPR) repeat protein